MAIAKSLRISPPKKIIDIKANAVVIEVIRVLDKVSFNDLFNISACCQDLYLLRFSLTLSKTTTVSFIE